MFIKPLEAEVVVIILNLAGIVLSCVLVALLVASLISPAHAQSSLPDPNHTPGALNIDVTPSTIHSTICVRGWTRTIRPPVAYTEALKRKQIVEFGYPDRHLSLYREDHLIPLELGGAPTDPDNLWPQPRHPADGWDDTFKDELESRLHHLVCTNKLDLVEAQQVIATDWRSAYNRFVIGE